MKQECGAGAARHQNEVQQGGAHLVNSAVNCTFVFAMYVGARQLGQEHRARARLHRSKGQ